MATTIRNTFLASSVLRTENLSRKQREVENQRQVRARIKESITVEDFREALSLAWPRTWPKKYHANRPRNPADVIRFLNRESCENHQDFVARVVYAHPFLSDYMVYGDEYGYDEDTPCLLLKHQCPHTEHGKDKKCKCCRTKFGKEYLREYLGVRTTGFETPRNAYLCTKATVMCSLTRQEFEDAITIHVPRISEAEIQLKKDEYEAAVQQSIRRNEKSKKRFTDKLAKDIKVVNKSKTVDWGAENVCPEVYDVEDIIIRNDENCLQMTCDEEDMQHHDDLILMSDEMYVQLVKDEPCVEGGVTSSVDVNDGPTLKQREFLDHAEEMVLPSPIKEIKDPAPVLVNNVDYVQIDNYVPLLSFGVGDDVVSTNDPAVLQKLNFRPVLDPNEYFLNEKLNPKLVPSDMPIGDIVECHDATILGLNYVVNKVSDDTAEINYRSKARLRRDLKAAAKTQESVEEILASIAHVKYEGLKAVNKVAHDKYLLYRLKTLLYVMKLERKTQYARNIVWRYKRQLKEKLRGPREGVVEGFMDAVSSKASKLFAPLTKTKNLLDDTLQGWKQVGDSVNGGIEQMTEGITSFFKQFNFKTTTISTLINVLTSFILLITGNLTLPRILLFFANIVSHLSGITTVTLNKIKRWIGINDAENYDESYVFDFSQVNVSDISDAEDAMTEAGERKSNTYYSVLKMIAFVVASITTIMIGSKVCLAVCMAQAFSVLLGSGIRDFINHANLFELFCKVLGTTTKDAFKRSMGLDVTESFLQEVGATMPIMIDNYFKLAEYYAENRTKITEDIFKDLCKKFQSMIEQIQPFLQAPDTRPIATGIMQQLFRAHNTLCNNYVSDGAMRDEPVFAYIYGRAGVGKTTMLNILQVELLQHLKDLKLIDKMPKDADEMMSYVYYRKSDADFWDGYKHQPITVYDDICQVNDSTTTPNKDLIEIINVCNYAHFPVNMAAVEDKGKTFTSPLILSTSNARRPLINSLHCDQAVYRRLVPSFHVQLPDNLKDQYDKYDLSFLNGDISDYSTLPWVFTQYDMTTHKNIRTNLKLNDVIKIIKEELSKKKIHKVDYQGFINNLLKNKEGTSEAGGDLIINGHESMSSEAIVQYEYETVMTMALNCGVTKLDLPADLILKYLNDNDIKGKFFTDEFTYIFGSDHSYEAFTPSQIFNLLHMMCGVDTYNLTRDPIQTPQEYFDKQKEVAKPKIYTYCEKIRKLLDIFVDKVKTFISGIIKHPIYAIAGFFSILGIMLMGSRVSSYNDADAEIERYKSDPKQPARTRTLKQIHVIKGRTESMAVGLDHHGQKHCFTKFMDLVRTASPSSLRNFFKDNKVTHAENYIDENASKIGDGILRNMYTVYGIKEDGSLGPRVVNVLFVAGKFFLAPHHAFDMFDAYYQLKFRSMFTSDFVINTRDLTVYNYGKNDILEDKAKEYENDFSIYKCPRSVREHRNIIDRFITTDDATRWTSNNAVMYTIDNSLSNFLIPRLYENLQVTQGVINYRNTDGDLYSIVNGLTYTCNTETGDCGSPLILLDKSSVRKVCGFHVSGTSSPFSAKRGHGVTVTQDTIMEGLRNLGYRKMETDIPGVSDTGIAESNNGIAEATGLERVGTSEHAYLTPGKSKYQLTKIGEARLFPNDKLPAVLKPTLCNEEITDPMLKAVRKVCMVTHVNDSCLIESARLDVLNLMEKNTNKDLKRLMTDREMICGIEGDDFSNPVHRGTSSGFYWSKITNQPGKKEFLGSDEVYIYDPRLKEAVDRREELCREGTRTMTVWTDSLKDELRPLDKVAACKTRLFSAAPLDYTLLFRKYFMGFATHVTHNNISNEISIGINCFGQDWTRLARHLSHNREHFVAGDFSNYDGTLCSDVLWAILDLINSWYNDSSANKKVRETLWHEIVNSFHVYGNDIVQWDHGNPSGNPFTAIINCLYNSISLRMLFVLITKKQMFDFKNFVTLVSYGDDNLIGISESVIMDFNQITLTDGYKKYFGMTYTNESKTGEIIPYRKLDEVSFLKRSFVYDENSKKFLAPIEIDSIYPRLNWYKTTTNELDQITENIESAQREAFMHGRGFFNLFTAKCRQALTYYDLADDLITYDECYYKWKSDLFNCYFDVGAVTRLNNIKVIGIAEAGGTELDATSSSGTDLAAEKSTLQLEQPQPVDETPETTARQIVTFLDDKTSMAAVNARNCTTRPVETTMEPRDHTLKDMISRFVNIHTSEVSGSTDVIYNGYPIADMLNASSMLEERISKFTYFRSDILLKMMINANPFTQGKFMAGLLVQPKTNHNQWFDDEAIPNIYTLSTMPHCIVDVNSQQSVVWKIPFVYDKVAWTLTDDKWNDNYRVVVRTLNGVKSGDTTTKVTFTISACFDNPQISVPSPSAAGSLAYLTDIRQEMKSMVTTQKEALVAKFKEFLEQTRIEGSDESKKDPLSSGSKEPNLLDTVGGVVNHISSLTDNIPSVLNEAVGSVGDLVGGVLGDVSSMAKPLLDVGEGLGGLLGFSKPKAKQQPMTMFNIPAYGYTHGSYVDNGVSLSYSPCPEVREEGLGGICDDEMSQGFVIGRSGLVSTSTWSDTQAIKDEIVKIEISPWNYNVLKYEKHSIHHPTPLGSFCRFFRYWRGSINLHLQLVKTAFVSGRLLLQYIPPSSSANEDPSENISVVWDIRETSDLKFNVPFVDMFVMQERGAPHAYIKITVLNALRVTDTVAKSVDLNVFMSGGNDSMFAVPYTGAVHPPFSPTLPEGNGDGAVVDVSGIADYPSFFKMAKVDKVDNSKFHFGEIVGSFRGLCKMFDRESNIIGVTTLVKSDPTVAYRVLGIDPGARIPTDFDRDTTKFVKLKSKCRLVEVGRNYRYYRGGVRAKVLFSKSHDARLYGHRRTVTLVDASKVKTGYNFIFAAAYKDVEDVDPSEDSMKLSHFIYTNINPVLEFTIPFYSKYVMRQWDSKEQEEHIAAVDFHVEDGFTLLLAGADDFSFHFYMGACPFVVPNPE